MPVFWIICFKWQVTKERSYLVTPISSFSFLFHLSASSNSFYFSIPSLLYQLKQKHTLKCWIKECLPFIDFLSLLIKYSHEDVTLNVEEVATANKITIFSSFAITIKKYLFICMWFEHFNMKIYVPCKFEKKCKLTPNSFVLILYQIRFWKLAIILNKFEACHEFLFSTHLSEIVSFFSFFLNLWVFMPGHLNEHDQHIYIRSNSKLTRPNFLNCLEMDSAIDDT